MSISLLPVEVKHFLREKAEELAQEKDFEILETLPALCAGVYKIDTSDGHKVLKLTDSRITEVRAEWGDNIIEDMHLDSFIVMKALHLESVMQEEFSELYGIPKLVEYHGPDNFYFMPIHRAKSLFKDLTVFLIRDYVEGEPLGYRYGHTMSHDISITENADLLENVVHKMHEGGYAGFDLVPANVILDTEGVPHFVDFVTPFTAKKGHVREKTFENYKAIDLRRLESLVQYHK